MPCEVDVPRDGRREKEAGHSQHSNKASPKNRGPPTYPSHPITGASDIINSELPRPWPRA